MESEQLQVSVNLQDLAHFLFVSNSNDATVQLSLDKVKDVDELFYFFVHIFFKGLILLYGTDNSVEIETVNEEQLAYTCKKMLNAGIECIIKVDPSGACNPPSIMYLKPKTLKVEDYCMILKTPLAAYTLSFKLQYMG